MSSLQHIPSLPEIDYQADLHEARRRRARRQIDPGDVLSVIDSRIAAEPDLKAHPPYAMVCWFLERQLTPLDGGHLFDTFRSLCLSAIDQLVDETLAVED